MKAKRSLIVAGILILFVGLPLFLAWNFLLGPVLEVTSNYRSLLGKSSDEVVSALGQPSYRLTAQQVKAKGIDFPWRDAHYQPVPDRVVSNEVWLYKPDKRRRSTPLAVYVFIDKENRVEAIDFAGQ